MPMKDKPSNWCISRNLSWDAVREICSRYKISFEELPVMDNPEVFWRELYKVARVRLHVDLQGIVHTTSENFFVDPKGRLR